MKDNWDGDGALAPNALAFDNLQTVAAFMRPCPPHLKRVGPTVEGGFMMSFRSKDKYADVECTNEGEVLWVIKNTGETSVVWETGLNTELIKSSVERLLKFLES